MISVAFINDGYEPLLASDPFFSFDKMVLETSEEIDSMIASYLSVHNQYMIESEIMGELDEEKSLYLESEKTNIFDKIGNGVIKIANALIETIKKIIQWVKDLGFKNKAKLDKAEDILNHCKKNKPKEDYDKYATEFMKAVDKGTINMIDVKTLAEGEKKFDDMVKSLKSSEIDPNTFRGKLEALKKTLDNAEDSKVNKASKVAKTVVGAGVAIATIRGTILKSRKDIMDWEKSSTERNEKMAKAIDELKTKDGGKYSPENMTKAQILYNAYVLMTNSTKKLITAEEGKLKDIDNGITSWLKKYEKTKADELLDGAARVKQKMDAEKQSRLDSEYETKYTQARAQIKANDDAILDRDSSHRKALKKETEIKAKQQERTKGYVQDSRVLGNRYDRNAGPARNHNRATDTEARIKADAQRQVRPKRP